MATLTDLTAIWDVLDGLPYVLGAELDPRLSPEQHKARRSPSDCSELVEYCIERLGLYSDFPDGTKFQSPWLYRNGYQVPIDLAFTNPGYLLYRHPNDDRNRPGHVAFTAGQNRTFEARGRAWGVGYFGGATSRRWSYAYRVPNLDYQGALMDREDLRMIQKDLQEVGLYQGSDLDGLWGPKSKAAARAYQTRKGYTATGDASGRWTETLAGEAEAKRHEYDLPYPELPRLEAIIPEQRIPVIEA